MFEHMKSLRSLAILVLASLMLCACQAEDSDAVKIMELQDSALYEPQKTEVIRGDIQVSYTYDAQVGPKVEQLTFPRSGNFGKYEVKIGEQVKKGQILARADVEYLESAIESKTKDVENHTHDYEYNKATLENSIKIEKLKLEKIYKELETLDYGEEKYTEKCVAAGNSDQARKRLEIRRRQLDEKYELEHARKEKELATLKEQSTNNLIVAPFDGVVVAIADAEYGNYINTDNDYIAVADENVLYARCESAGIGMIRNAEKEVLLLNGKVYDTNYVPRTDKYYLKMKNSTETSYEEFEVIDPDGEVSLGDVGKIRYIMGEKKNVLLIPNIALLNGEGNTYVYKDVDGQHQKTIVKTGAKTELMVEITDGLSEGDVVYVQE